jgi:hypothetical protein
VTGLDLGFDVACSRHQFQLGGIDSGRGLADLAAVLVE